MAEKGFSKRTYVLVAIALLLLLAITAGADWFDLGVFNTVVAIGVAVCKALLVMLFFMEIKASPKVMWLFAGAGFFWLTILIVLTLSDVLTRIQVHLPFAF